MALKRSGVRASSAPPFVSRENSLIYKCFDLCVRFLKFVSCNKLQLYDIHAFVFFIVRNVFHPYSNDYRV